MKILIKNSEMVFQKSTIIEDSYERVFAAGDVGGSAIVEVTLTTPTEANTPVQVSVSGDAGVVTNNIWNLQINGGTSFGTINTGGSVEITPNVSVTKVYLQRDSVAAAGAIKLTVRYSL